MGKGVGRICCKFGLENLPLDPFRHILRYLSLYDLSNFDQILHEFSSPSFLEYFHEICHKMIISNDDNYKYLYLSLSQIKWLYSHHIVLTHLYLLDENYELGINYINLIHQHLQFLKINSEIMKNEEFLKLSFLHFPHLHTLALSSSRINDDAVQRFLRINSHLQTLTLHNTPIISNNFLNFIANNCIHLQSFKIVDCHWFTDDSISYLVGGRLNLKFLTFLGVKVIKIQSYEQIIESFSNLKLIQFLPNNNISLEIILLVIRRIAIPAMKSSILDDHILGIESIEYIYNNTVALNKKLSALDALSSSLNVIPTLIQLILTIEENEKVKRHSLSLVATFSTQFSDRIVDSDISRFIYYLIDMLKTKNSDTMGYAARILLNMSEVNDICREIFLLDGLCPLVESFYVDILNRTNPQLTKIMNKSSLDLLTKTLFLLFKSPFVDADMHKYLNILNYLLCSHTPVHHIYQALADINFIDILLEIMKRFSDNHCIHTVCISLLSHFFLGQTPLIPWTTPLRATLSSFACNSDADLHLIQDCIIQQDRITGSRDPLNVP